MLLFSWAFLRSVDINNTQEFPCAVDKPSWKPAWAASSKITKSLILCIDGTFPTLYVGEDDSNCRLGVFWRLGREEDGGLSHVCVEIERDSVGVLLGRALITLELEIEFSCDVAIAKGHEGRGFWFHASAFFNVLHYRP